MSPEAQRWQEYHESGLWIDADLPNSGDGEPDHKSPSFICCISEQGIAPPLWDRIGHC